MLCQRKTLPHKLGVKYSWCTTCSLFYTGQINFNQVQNHANSDKSVMVSTSLVNFAPHLKHNEISWDESRALVLLCAEYQCIRKMRKTKPLHLRIVVFNPQQNHIQPIQADCYNFASVTFILISTIYLHPSYDQSVSPEAPSNA